jgi:hypothetical protein
MNAETQQWEAELREAGWRPVASHPNSPVWLDPGDHLFPGPGYAHLLMTEQKLRHNQQENTL